MAAEAERPALFVAAPVVHALTRLPARPWEVGGWLLGYWAVDKQSVFVTHATPPVGRGTARGVRIDGRGHRDRFDEAWEASAGVVTFLGDWHTHPGGPTRPSARDTRAARQLAEDVNYGTPQPVLGIVALPRWRRGRTRRHVRWWWGPPENAGLLELDAVAVDELPLPASSVPGWPWPRAADPPSID